MPAPLADEHPDDPPHYKETAPVAQNFSFTVDQTHNKENNEYFRDGRRLRLSAIIMTVLALAGAAGSLWLFGTGAVGIVLAVLLVAFAAMCVFVAVKLPGATGSPQEVYDRWPLAPAMIAQVDERTMVLMALVNANMDETGTPQKALATRTIMKVSGVPRRVGARVPAVGVAGRHRGNADAWEEITPVPIGWATKDRKTVREAERAIPEGDWQLLQANLDRVDDVRSTKFDLLML